MVQTIQFGNLASVNGRSILSGSASQIDTESLMEGLVEIKGFSKVSIEDELAANADKVLAYNEMNTLLKQFQDSVDLLRNPPGVNNATKDIFGYRTSSLSASDGSTATNYVGVTAGAGADTADYDLTITQLARAEKLTSAAFTSKTGSVTEAASGTTSGMFSAGTFTLNGKGTDVSVTLEEGDTLVDIAAKINNSSSASGVKASIVQVASNDFRMVMEATDTGTANAFNANTVDATGVLSEVTFTQTTALDANFTVDGLAITRSSNKVTDVIDDVTFDLKQTTGAATVTANVLPDTSIMRDAIIGMADAYNNFKVFAAEQQRFDSDGNPLEDSILARETTLSLLVSEVSQTLTNTVSGLTSGDPSTLADIGITFSDYPGDDETPATSNIMTVDSTALDTALLTDYDEVQKVFGFHLSSSSADLQVYQSSNAVTISSFTLDIDTTANTASVTYNDGTGNQTISMDYTQNSTSATLTGKDGTVLEGMQLIYTGSTATGISVTTTQGIADQLYNNLDDYTDAVDGLIEQEIDNIESEDSRLGVELDRLEEQLDVYRESLLVKFAALESAISAANSLLLAIDAQNSARNQ